MTAVMMGFVVRVAVLPGGGVSCGGGGESSDGGICGEDGCGDAGFGDSGVLELFTSLASCSNLSQYFSPGTTFLAMGKYLTYV